LRVYLATSGEYSDYHVNYVFARKEDASAYIAHLQDGHVEEYDVREGPIQRRTWYRLIWRTDTGDRGASPPVGLANPSEHAEYRDFDGRVNYAEHQWVVRIDGVSVLHVSGWDLERVRKVYSEQRAKHEAQKAGL
jgi:hypothetical protein